MNDPEPLPRGRHSLSREEVADTQRRRIYRAIISLVDELGYRKVSITLITKRAKVSRETFYQHFENKEKCFLAAYDDTATVLSGLIMNAQAELPQDAEPIDRIDSAIGCYLDLMAENPPMARAFLVEVFSAGGEAVDRLLQFREGFVAAALAIRGQSTDKERFRAEAYLGAMITIATRLALEGRAAESRSLREPMRDLARRMLLAERILDDGDDPADATARARAS